MTHHSHGIDSLSWVATILVPIPFLNDVVHITTASFPERPLYDSSAFYGINLRADTVKSAAIRVPDGRSTNLPWAPFAAVTATIRGVLGGRTPFTPSP